MSNIRGKAYALNVITPMRSWKSWVLKAVFFLLRYKPLQQDLHNLSFIHFARWTILPSQHFPHFMEQTTREKLTFDYLLFESNFNGSWSEYIDAFNAALWFKLNLVWFWSEKYPGAVPLTPFKNYIVHNQIYNDYYYMAYPGHAVNDVKNALHVHREFKNLVQACEQSDEQFEQAFQSFFTDVQNQLGESGGRGPEMT